MAGPGVWSVCPSPTVAWWPTNPNNQNEIDILCDYVGQDLEDRLGKVNADEEEILLYAAGPIGAGGNLSAELVVRAFFQSAYGPLRPAKSELADILPVICRPIPPRLWLPGTYMCFEEHSGFVRDWMMAPLAWRLEPDTQEWLSPQRQLRGIHVPASWIVKGALGVVAESEQITINLGGQVVGRYKYWHDDLNERQFLGTGSRVGGELQIRKEWLEAHLSAGATLCWVATLLIAEREEYKERFNEPSVAHTWIIGGSNIVFPRPWQPS